MVRKRRTKEQISYNMSRIKAKGSVIEKIMAGGLRRRKIKFLSHYSKIVGNPDFVLLKAKIAIFCDSSFWHGYRNMKTKLHAFKNNKKFWRNKIKSNILRDRKVNRLLKKDGWGVLRFWDFRIEKEPELCLDMIQRKLLQKA